MYFRAIHNRNVLLVAGISQQRAYVGLDVACGDYRDDTHMFQLTKAYDVVQYIKRTQV